MYIRVGVWRHERYRNSGRNTVGTETPRQKLQKATRNLIAFQNLKGCRSQENIEELRAKDAAENAEALRTENKARDVAALEIVKARVAANVEMNRKVREEKAEEKGKRGDE